MPTLNSKRTKKQRRLANTWTALKLMARSAKYTSRIHHHRSQSALPEITKLVTPIATTVTTTATKIATTTGAMWANVAMTATTGTEARADATHLPEDEPHQDVELLIDVVVAVVVPKDVLVHADDPGRQFIDVHGLQERIATDVTAQVAVAPIQIRAIDLPPLL